MASWTNKSKNTTNFANESKSRPKWLDATVYAENDLVSYKEVAYICISAHTSDIAGGDGSGGTPDINSTEWTSTGTLYNNQTKN